jgi:hypothetical protein
MIIILKIAPTAAHHHIPECHRFENNIIYINKIDGERDIQ